MKLLVKQDYEAASKWAADYIARRIHKYGPTAEDPFVLGLPTGASPLGTYRELIHLHRQGTLSFQHVVTFNMDEYIGIPEDHPQSYHSYMAENLFRHIDIQQENAHIPNGNAVDMDAECRAYEEKIKAHGGIDLFFSGVGHDGHIAFNMPGSALDSRTHVQQLNQQTIKANSRFFDGDTSKVPTRAITIGVGTITDADQVLVLVNGREKAIALKHGIEEPVSHLWAISALQLHPDAIIVCDQPSTEELSESTLELFTSFADVE